MQVTTRTSEKHSDEPRETITGPHLGYDKYGNRDHKYYRCEVCGYEVAGNCIRDKCSRCGAEAN